MTRRVININQMPDNNNRRVYEVTTSHVDREEYLKGPGYYTSSMRRRTLTDAIEHGMNIIKPDTGQTIDVFYSSERNFARLSFRAGIDSAKAMADRLVEMAR